MPSKLNPTVAATQDREYRQRDKTAPVGVPGVTTKESLARVKYEATNATGSTFNVYHFGYLVAVGVPWSLVLDMVAARPGEKAEVLKARLPRRRAVLESVGDRLKVSDVDTGEAIVFLTYNKTVGERLRRIVDRYNLEIINRIPAIYN